MNRLSRAETQALLQRLPAIFQTQINDALLTALALALQRWTGSEALRIDLEGHGREPISDGVDVSRTVGWFTTLFPIALNVQPGIAVADSLLAVRDQLKRVPDRGLSYGLLRYWSADPAVRAALSGMPPSPVLFNYLGRFDAVVADSTVFASHGIDRAVAQPARTAHTRARNRRDRPRRPTGDRMAPRCGRAARSVRSRMLPSRLLAGLRELLAPLPSHRRRTRACGLPAGEARCRNPGEFELARYPSLEDVYPLTPMQRLFFAMETSHSRTWLRAVALPPRWRRRHASLRRAIEHVVARHSILRTAFVDDVGAEPLQVVLHAAGLCHGPRRTGVVSRRRSNPRAFTICWPRRTDGLRSCAPPMMRIALRRIADES